jgi:hypothetical protein
MSPAGAHMLIQVGHRLSQPDMMGGQYCSAGGRVAQAVEDRDALGRPQDHVERWDSVATMRSAEQRSRRRVAALEHSLESRRRCFALQPKGGGAGAAPPSWGLTVTG